MTTAATTTFLSLPSISFNPERKHVAIFVTRWAISCKPLGPWNTAYEAAQLARRACAVQMLEVALSRRMCCSRVCIAKR